ncbi:hypothetical protein ACL02T_32330 [Pseudonocardia sp. RS010]|uniref:hypothetical protein n=1 Tax=Pseudonocardia sp. RS010 TaxID=3385979 RepID=UPI00399F3979
MKPFRGSVVAAVAAASCLTLAGCAGDTVPGAAAQTTATAPAPTDGSGQPQADTVAWAGQVCSALAPVYQSLGAPPQPDLNDLAATRDAYLTYFENAGSAAEQAANQIGQAGAPPTDNGAAVRDDLQAQLNDLRDNLTAARDQLANVDTSDPAAVADAVRSAGQTAAGAGDAAQVRDTLNNDPELAAAVQQAPECADLPLGQPGSGG